MQTNKKRELGPTLRYPSGVLQAWFSKKLLFDPCERRRSRRRSQKQEAGSATSDNIFCERDSVSPGHHRVPRWCWVGADESLEGNMPPRKDDRRMSDSGSGLLLTNQPVQLGTMYRQFRSPSALDKAYQLAELKKDPVCGVLFRL